MRETDAKSVVKKSEAASAQGRVQWYLCPGGCPLTVSFPNPNPNPNPLNVVTFKSFGESDLVSPFSQVFQSDKVSGQVLQVFIQLS